MKVFISSSRADRPFAERLRKEIAALAAEVLGDSEMFAGGENWDQALRNALEASDALVLVVPEPGARKANTAFFEAGAARALGKPVVAVLPSADASRAGELPSDMYGLAVFDGSKVAPESLANSIVAVLKAA
jgi:nucleoside 2-deoxyribosyltransferase